MKRALAHIFTLTFTIGFIGCGAGPEKVCDHLIKLAEKSVKREHPRKQAVKFAKSRAGCVSELTGLKTMDSDKFEDFSKCVLEAPSHLHATHICSDEVGLKPNLEDRVAPTTPNRPCTEHEQVKPNQIDAGQVLEAGS